MFVVSQLNFPPVFRPSIDELRLYSLPHEALWSFLRYVPVYSFSKSHVKDWNLKLKALFYFFFFRVPNVTSFLLLWKECESTSFKFCYLCTENQVSQKSFLLFKIFILIHSCKSNYIRREIQVIRKCHLIFWLIKNGMLAGGHLEDEPDLFFFFYNINIKNLNKKKNSEPEWNFLPFVRFEFKTFRIRRRIQMWGKKKKKFHWFSISRRRKSCFVKFVTRLEQARRCRDTKGSQGPTYRHLFSRHFNTKFI